MNYHHLIRDDGGQRTVGQKLYHPERKAETKTNKNPSHPAKVSFKNKGKIEMFSD